LSISRGTRVSFSTGSTAIKTERGVTYRTQMTGNFRLSHQIGRTWTAFAGYNRSLRFVETLIQPVSSNSVSAGLNGLISRRVQFQSAVRSSLGSVGEFGRNNDYDSYQASAALGVAINTQMNFGLSYSYYSYTFGESVILPIGVPSNVDRQSVRATLTLWAPVF
jgi:hypothetical protein